MKLIDTNVVIYSLGEEHSYRDSCIQLMERAYSGTLLVALDTEVLQEVLFVYHGRRRLDFGLAVFDSLIRGLPDPLPVLRSTMVHARSILAAHPNVQPRDAVHAAVVVENRLDGIISADRAFDAIAGLARFDPLELDKSW